MVNPGHRSMGCAQCRKSKIKCDEGRPACGRCVRTGRICSGYPRPASPSFAAGARSSQSRVLQERLEVNSRQNQRATSAPRSTDDLVVQYSTPLAFQTPVPSLSTMVPTADWTEQSVALFFKENVEGPDHLYSTWGNLEFLPALYQKYRSPYLTQAVNAAALSYMANVSSMTELENMGRVNYGKALEGVSMAMADSALLAEDETLAALNTLAMYEIIAGQRPLSQLFHAHFFGQSTILHLQKNRPAKCTTLFGMTNRSLMWRDLASRSRPYLCVSDWPTATYSSSLGEISARLTLRIVDVCGRSKELIDRRSHREEPQLQENFAALARDAAQLHEDLELYFETASDEWRSWSLPHDFPEITALDPNSSVHAISNLVTSIAGWGLPGGAHLRSRPTQEMTIPSCPSRIDIYPSRSIAFLWSGLRCVWLHLCQTLVDLQLFAVDRDLIETAQSVNLPLIEDAYTKLSTLILDVCAAVPFFMGDVDRDGKLNNGDLDTTTGFGLLWLMHRICAIPGINPALRAWIVTIFNRIGHRGLKRGLYLAKLHGD